jgi:hypothetical protein
MANTLIAALVGYLEKHASVGKWIGRVDIGAVDTLEKELGFSLGDSFRFFVERLGCGNIGAFDVLGLGVAADGVPHAGFVRKQLIKTGLPVPKDCLPVVILPTGGYYFLLGEGREGMPAHCIVAILPDNSLQLRHSCYEDMLLNLIAPAILS